LKVFSQEQKEFTMKKDLKMHTDPWDHYLVHDSKAFLPLICTQNSLKIEEQILVAEFIMHAIKNESISEYKMKGEELVKELLAFAKTQGKS